MDHKQTVSSIRDGRLVIDMGLVSVKVSSRINTVQKEVANLYRDFTKSTSPDAWCDYSLSIIKPRNIRYFFKPQASMLFDEHTPFKPLPLAHAFPLFEWGLNWAVANHYHDYLILHAAVVEKNGSALVLPAPPGSGKSTLCALLVLNGWRLLSDEMTVIDINTGEVTPFVRPICLKNDSIPLIRAAFPDVYLSKTAVDTQKGNVAHIRPPKSSIEQAKIKAKIAAIVFPSFQGGEKTTLEYIPQTSALTRLVENAFNFDLFGRDGFELLSNIVKESLAYNCVYSDFTDLEPKLFELLSNK